MLTPEEARGMTVNERLFAAGVIEEFDAAISRGDEEALRRILATLFLGESNVEAIVRQVLGRR